MNETFDSVIKGRTLDVDLRSAGIVDQSLNALCTDLFLIVMNITSDVDMGTEDDIRRILKYYVDQFVQNCNAVKISKKKQDYVKYALVALIDEKVLKLPKKWSVPWSSHMLQLDYFGDMVAGNRFFEYLDLLMQNPNANYDVLEIYYLCLCLGFKGMYLHDVKGLQEIIHRLPKMILAATPSTPKPAVQYTPKETRSRRIIPHIPTWGIASMAVGIVIIAWIGIVIATRNITRDKLLEPEMIEKTEVQNSLRFEHLSG